MQANHAQGDPARDFQNLELVLSRSEKGGIGWNSRYFNRVKAALQRTAKAMEKDFDGETMKNMQRRIPLAVSSRSLNL